MCSHFAGDFLALRCQVWLEAGPSKGVRVCHCEEILVSSKSSINLAGEKVAAFIFSSLFFGEESPTKPGDRTRARSSGQHSTYLDTILRLKCAIFKALC